jgi:transposase InsO family protein
VKSVTQTRFGAWAVKSRFSRSPARTPSLAGIVVRTCLSRRTPDKPNSRMARSTAPADASRSRVRRTRAVILRRPYRTSGASTLMETINGLYKAECIRTTVFQQGPFKTLADVEYATAGWVDWYNQRRLHGSLA